MYIKVLENGLDQQPHHPHIASQIIGEGRWQPFSPSVMEHKYGRGIHRPNAQRLNISVAPLVAQRSLVFRGKTDLAMKTSYAELTPTEESPALYSLSGSAQIVTAVLSVRSAAISTPKSSASMYSQDSWNTESPLDPVFKVDPRRMAIAFSPGVQWSHMGDNNKGFTAESPLVSSLPRPDASFSEDNHTKTHSATAVVPTLARHVVPEPVGNFPDVRRPSQVEETHTKINSKRKKIDEQSAKRSKPSKAFRKVMDHLAFQPSQLLKADATAISKNLPSMDFKLPKFRVSPIRPSFIAQTKIVPPVPRAPSSMVPSFDLLFEEGGEDAVGVHQLHAAMPPHPERKGHRRFQSSPTVPLFRRWDRDNMPPLPSLPAGPLEPTLSRSRSVAGHGPTNIPRPYPLAI